MMKFDPILPLFEDQNAPQEADRITEITIPEGAHSARHLLAGMLRELNSSEDCRWLCWVGTSPVKPLIRESPKQSGEHILQVVTQRADEVLSLAERALCSGRSHTVAVLIHHEMSADDRSKLQSAALSGDADCLAIRMPQG